MFNQFDRIVQPKLAEEILDKDFAHLGVILNRVISKVFRRNFAVRELDSGSDNATEIELNNLCAPHYDIERFGVSFVASQRHADVLVVTGTITHGMEIAVRKTYEAVPAPKLVIAVGDDASGGGIWGNTYAVNGGVNSVIPVGFKIPGNPPTPLKIMEGLV